jgi:hypothetical protein
VTGLTGTHRDGWEANIKRGATEKERKKEIKRQREKKVM